MKNNNEQQKRLTLKRKTLSLGNNKNSQLDKNNGQIKIEIKRKRSGLNRGRSNENSLSKYSLNGNGTAMLTDDEFRARVKALQNAMNVEKHENNDGVEDISQPNPSSNQKTTTDIGSVKEKSPKCANEISADIKKRAEPELIDKLIKMAPKNNKTAQSEPIKPVVFRSDAFAKKTRANEKSTKEPNKLNNKKSEHNTKFSDKLDKRMLYPSQKSKNGSFGRMKNNEKNQDQNKRVLNAGAQMPSRKGISGGTVTAPQPANNHKNLKPARKFKTNRDDRDDIFVSKSNSGKFSKKDLELAMNDEDANRSRSVASIKRARQKFKSGNSPTFKVVVREVNIPDSISVGELANRMAVRASEVVKYLMSVGTMATINQIIDGETAEIVCTSFGHVAKRISDDDFEQELNYSSLDTPDKLDSRAPIVAVMGHVDHGKTTLLDALRKTSVAKKEAGGITQHVAAYQVKGPSGKDITFIDTPGHAAFSNIRARGAKLTDMIVLVVAADDGIKEQTVEVIKEAHNQNVPLVIAINKIDKPNIDINRVKNELMQYNVILEEFGGEVLCVEISTKNNTNLDKLLENILLQAEVLDLKANADRKANCTILETRMEKGRGIVASVIVDGGTLHVGDVFVAGTTYGKIRTISDSNRNRLQVCTPAMPVEITGFDKTPEPGDTLIVVDSEQKAHEISEKRRELQSRKKATKLSIKNMNDMMADADQGIQTLNVYIKADVYGSLEAIEASLLAISNSEIKVSVIGKSIGLVTESDVDFALASSAIVVCFNTNTTPTAKSMAKILNVKVISYDVVYHLINAVIEIMEDMLPPVIEENYIGRLLVKKLFFISRLGTIAGGVVVDGVIRKNDSKVRIIRSGKLVFEGTIKSMKHEKDEIKECGLNRECGILIENFNDFEESDYIECFEIRRKKRSLTKK